MNTMLRVLSLPLETRVLSLIAKAQDQTVQPLERAEIVAENDLKMATRGDDRRAILQQGGKGGFGARHRGKVVRQIESTGIFCALASAMFCGERVNRQLKAKNITTATISMLAREMICEHLRSVYSRPNCASYSSRLETTNEETIGEVEGEHHDGDAQPYRHQNAVVTG